MVDSVSEFKEFVRAHPGLKDEVNAKKATWQSLYETWYLYGSADRQWDQYQQASQAKADSKVTETVRAEVVNAKSELSGPEMMAQAFEYLQKVDIDKVQKTMGTFQQFIQIFQTMQNGKGATATAGGLLGGAAKKHYSGFFSQFDD